MTISLDFSTTHSGPKKHPCLLLGHTPHEGLPLQTQGPQLLALAVFQRPRTDARAGRPC